MKIRITKSVAKVTHEKQCLMCEAWFISNRTTAKYCSNSCRIGFYLMLHPKQ